MPARAAAVAPLLAASLLAAGCGRNEERIADLDLYAAIERLRSATSDSGPDRLLKVVAVEQLPAHSAAAIEAQRACAGAYRKLVEAEDAIFQAEMMLKHTQGVHAPTGSAAAEVVRAEEQLKKAREAMPACDAAAARLAVAAR